jgi:hypothetical protein
LESTFSQIENLDFSTSKKKEFYSGWKIEINPIAVGTVSSTISSLKLSGFRVLLSADKKISYLIFTATTLKSNYQIGRKKSLFLPICFLGIKMYAAFLILGF